MLPPRSVSVAGANIYKEGPACICLQTGPTFAAFMGANAFWELSTALAATPRNLRRSMIAVAVLQVAVQVL